MLHPEPGKPSRCSNVEPPESTPRDLFTDLSIPRQGHFARALAAINLRLDAPRPDDEFFPSREIYQQFVGPDILPARTFASPRLYISGLAATTYHWRHIHEHAHAKHGGHSEVSCLRGHDQGFFSMLDTTLDDWVSDVTDRALAIRDLTGRLPVLHGHSTGALVALVAVVRYGEKHPGEALCSGLILSAPPFELRQTMHRIGLVVAQVLRKVSAGAEFWRRFGASMEGGGLDPDIPGQEPPTARWLPVQMLIELERLRALALSLVPNLKSPVLVLHGTSDVIAKWTKTAAVFKRFPRNDRELVIVRGARHSMMFGSHAAEFTTTIEQWIEAHQPAFDRSDERSLRTAIVRSLKTRWVPPSEAHFEPAPIQPPRRGWLFRWR